MRAVRVHRFGERPVVEDVPEPEWTPGHTLVRIGAATVGHIDRTISSGDFFRHPPLPYTPGVEGAGVVFASDRYGVGERVWIRGGGLGTAVDGTWAELVSAPDESLGALPDGVPDPVGSAFFSPCTSAWVALRSIAEVTPGHRVAITGANGAVGAIAVQLAREVGAEIVGTVSRPDRLDLLDDDIDRLVVDGRVPVEIEPVDVVIDTVGGPVLESLIAHVRPGGTVVLIGYLAGPTITLDLPALIQRDVSLRPLNMVRREPQGRAVAGQLLERIADARLTVDVTTFPFAEAAAALSWLGEPGHRGRAVLVPEDPT